MLRAVGCALLVIAACKGNDRAPAKTEPPAVVAPPAAPKVKRDPRSQSEPDRIAVRHLSLDLAVSFDAKTLAGTATLKLDRRDPSAKELVLDTDELTIEAVTDCTSKQPLVHTLAPVHKDLGRALTIAVASDCVAIAYRTAPSAKAILWVEPSGTAGKQKPMLFTQSQAIFARTWIPLQDTPGVRFTYEATIRIPDGLWALMSATNPQAAPADKVWRFTMEHPIPSYLMALAVGDFAFRPIGERTGVYSEPSVVDAAAKEFAEVDAMMAAAEKLYGPYRWGRYDILVLPPSFPFGGMENPRLTFLTPTVITGDRALVSLIAHELAHSWSGNLVTNSTWNDLWLNEGFTTYVERRIMEELRGKDIADVGWWLGRKDLEKALDEAGRTHPNTRLALDFDGSKDPDAVSSDITYEKGSLFLRALEFAFGREAFDAFLKARFDRLAFTSTDSATFERDVNTALFETTRVDWRAADWLHKPGLPATAPPSTSKRAAEIEQLAAAFAKDGTMPPAGWTTLEWIVFLRSLPKDITKARLVALDRKYKLTPSTNALISLYWLPHMINADAREVAPTVEAYLMRVGRRWLVRTIYAALVAKNEFWRELAATTFEKAKPLYHAATRDTIADLLAPKP